MLSVLRETHMHLLKVKMGQLRATHIQTLSTDLILTLRAWFHKFQVHLKINSQTFTSSHESKLIHACYLSKYQQEFKTDRYAVLSKSNTTEKYLHYVNLHLN